MPRALSPSTTASYRAHRYAGSFGSAASAGRVGATSDHRTSTRDTPTPVEAMVPRRPGSAAGGSTGRWSSWIPSVRPGPRISSGVAGRAGCAPTPRAAAAKATDRARPAGGDRRGPRTLLPLLGLPLRLRLGVELGAERVGAALGQAGERVLVAQRGERLVEVELEQRRRPPDRLDLELAVPLEAGGGRDQLADDHVLLQAAELVDLALEGRVGQHLGRLLEGGRREERLGGQGRLRDPQDQGLEARHGPLDRAVDVLVAPGELARLAVREQMLARGQRRPGVLPVED